MVISIQHAPAKPLKTRQLAVIAAFAALYSVLRLIPFIPLIGGTGTFPASDFVPSLFGVVLGPYVAAASITLGTLVAYPLQISLGRPLLFLGLDFLPAAINAVAVGLLVRKRQLIVLLLFAILLLLFVIHPLTLRLVDLSLFGLTFTIPYNWLHFVAFFLVLSPLAPRASKWVTEVSIPNLAKGFALLAFVGTMMQHLMGGLLTENIPGPAYAFASGIGWPSYWTLIFYRYPPERLIITIIATVIGVPVIRTLFVSRRIERLVSPSAGMTRKVKS